MPVCRVRRPDSKEINKIAIMAMILKENSKRTPTMLLAIGALLVIKLLLPIYGLFVRKLLRFLSPLAFHAIFAIFLLMLLMTLFAFLHFRKYDYKSILVINGFNIKLLLGLIFSLAGILSIQKGLIPIVGMITNSQPQTSTLILAYANTLLEKILIFVAIVLIAPVLEEFVFRGLIQSTFAEYFNIKIALIIQALLFAINHETPAAMIVTFISGIVFGYLVFKTKSIIAGILPHIGVNLYAFIMIIINKESLIKSTVSKTDINYLSCLFYDLLGIGLLLLGIMNISNMIEKNKGKMSTPLRGG
jgi:uncharacterized protein